MYAYTVYVLWPTRVMRAIVEIPAYGPYGSEIYSKLVFSGSIILGPILLNETLYT